MKKGQRTSTRPSTRSPEQPLGTVGRIERPLSLVAQVEQILREAIATGRFPGNRIPTEVELADQLGVSRETVRRATEALQREGLLVKFRRKGTFTQPPALSLQREAAPSSLLGYLQAGYQATQGQEEAVTRAIGGLMLQGALQEAGQAGFELVVRQAPQTQISEAFRQLSQNAPLRGVIFASYGEEKLLRRVVGLGLPTVLVDHDVHLPGISSVRDDSFEGAREAVRYLAGLGHRRIAFAHWHRTDLNPWRLMGYRQGLRDAGLPRRRVWELPTELTEAGAQAVTQSLLNLNPRPTALLCFNNSLARLVCTETRRHGLQIPLDLSVLGGGGEEVAGLTCYQVDWYQLGRKAVQILLRNLAAPGAPEHFLAPHTLRIGQTTAALS
jgi:LacI family transcriptional regulator